MRCSARFTAATALAAVSLVPFAVVTSTDGAQASFPRPLESLLTEEAHATTPERERLLAGMPLIKWLEYVTGYCKGGNARLGVHRDKERPTFVGHEVRSMINSAPASCR